MNQKNGFPTAKTIIDLQGVHSNDFNDEHCGYCHGSKKPKYGSVKWGLRSCKMTVQDYQVLMDRMWRRCGTYYYKYDLQKSCCQPYTIRLDTTEYQISQSQRKVMKRFNKFLKGQIDINGNKIAGSSKIEEVKMNLDQTSNQEKQQLRDEERRKIIEGILREIKEKYYQDMSEEDLSQVIKTSIIGKVKDKELVKTKSWASNCLIRIFFKNCEIKKIKGNIKEFVEQVKVDESLRINKKNEEIKIEDSGYLTFVNKELDDSAEIKKQGEQAKKKDKSSKKQEEEKKEKVNFNNDFFNYRQYFNELVPLELKDGEQIKHKYTVTLTRAVFDKKSFEVYQKYQEKVHNEKEKSASGYKNFLCQNPLFDPKEERECKRDVKRQNLDDDRDKKDEGVWPEYLGGYHMIHKIDDEVMAVGVLDFTPIALSSVYLFYDPKFENLSPGTFAAVREIEYTKKIQEYFCPEFKYYYMGLYFQDCQKSVYKGSYKPSQVVCPVTYNYVYLTPEVREIIAKEALPKLSDKVIIKEMNLNESQLLTLVKNFKFWYKGKEQLKIEHLNPGAQGQIKNSVISCYKNIGLDMILTLSFSI